jgi:hypothetical protein
MGVAGAAPITPTMHMENCFTSTEELESRSAPASGCSASLLRSHMPAVL